MGIDTNAHHAQQAEAVIAGSPGVALGAARAQFTVVADRRAARKFFDAYAAFRSATHDAAALSPATAPLYLRFLGIVGEHIPTHQDIDAALQHAKAQG